MYISYTSHVPLMYLSCTSHVPLMYISYTSHIYCISVNTSTAFRKNFTSIFQAFQSIEPFLSPCPIATR